jgi:hypothetical protein
MPEHSGIEVVVSDCVPPRHQFVEQRFPPAIVNMDGVDVIPKRQAQPPKIGPDRACVRVATAERLPPEKLGSHQSL